jgi:replicative DNA helicase Mcm
MKDEIKDSFTSLRGLYDYDEDKPVPVTFRSLEGIVRVAEAAAKFEFSETIQARHVEIATDLVGKSMQDIGRNEDGEMDADVHEVGESKSQTQRKKTVKNAILELQQESDNGNASVDEIYKLLDDVDDSKIEHEIELFKNEGAAYEPKTGEVRYIGHR